MVKGIGIDVVEIKRIREIMDKWGDKFLKKVFTEREISYAQSKINPAQHFAARFAAKEAFAKAAATGWKGSFRWKDIGGQLYAQSFIDSFSYAAANVVLKLDTPGLNYLGGSIVAAGLKPNFAYQIKLDGNPSKGGATPPDDAGNEIIGYRGRWWRIMPNPGNALDSEYNTYKNDPNYAYEGYLLVAYFVTDPQGNANVQFAGNNSYHVLWRTDQRSPAPNDGPPLAVTLPSTAGNPAYGVSVSERQYSLYGEWEPTRALPGTLTLPQGHYKCRVYLTEESFHDYGAQGGMWAAAMSGPLEFDIPTLQPQLRVMVAVTLAKRVFIAWGAGTTGKQPGDTSPLDWYVRDASGAQVGLNETCVSNDANNNLTIKIENTSNTGTNARIFATAPGSGGWNVASAPGPDTFAIKAQLGANSQQGLTADPVELTITTKLAKGADQDLVLTLMTPTSITRPQGTLFVPLTASPE